MNRAQGCAWRVASICTRRRNIVLVECCGMSCVGCGGVLLILSCCTPGGPPTSEALRDCQSHRFCAMRSSAVHRLAKRSRLPHGGDRGPCGNPTGFQKLQRVEECIQQNHRTPADCSRRRVDCPLMLGPRASQVRHPSWKWSASGTDASRRASNACLMSISSLVRAWSLCAVGQRAGEALFDLRARGAAQRRSRSVSCWRSGGLYQRQQQHDVGRRECRPPGALRVAARTVAARHRRQRWLAATPGVQRRLMVSSSDCAARRLAERLRGAVRTA